jgi:RHS repeat-associated protein
MERRCMLLVLMLFALPTQATVQLYYLHNDHLGTPRVVTNQAREVVWQGQLQPFGEIKVEVEAITHHRRSPGQRLDIEARLYYNYFRDYDPRTGRYMQSDPIGLGGGINTYAYVGGNPVMDIDPLGLRSSYCQRPLGDYSGKNGSGPPVINHQFICVTLEDGTVRCDSLNNPDNDLNGPFWPSIGQPSLPDRDNEENSQCEDIDDDEDRCFEKCALDQWAKPRPPYAIGPLGTDCQEYSRNLKKTCRQRCSQ